MTGGRSRHSRNRDMAIVGGNYSPGMAGSVNMSSSGAVANSSSIT